MCGSVVCTRDIGPGPRRGSRGEERERVNDGAPLPALLPSGGYSDAPLSLDNARRRGAVAAAALRRVCLLMNRRRQLPATATTATATTRILRSSGGASMRNAKTIGVPPRKTPALIPVLVCQRATTPRRSRCLQLRRRALAVGEQ